VTDPHTAPGVIARLKPGIAKQAALAELERLRPALAESYPQGKREFRFGLDILGESDVEKHRQSFVLLCGAVGLLVLIACLNVANLIVARSVARESEFAVRSALGAARKRLVLHVLIEILVLGFAGGALGTLLALAGKQNTGGLGSDALSDRQAQ
jgi:hypothetical protein